MDADHLYQRSPLARAALRRALDAADVVTGCSAYVIDELDRFSDGRHRAKMRVIPNGIDLGACRAAEPERRERPYVLGLGRLVAQKGYDLLVRAFALLAPELPDHELVIAGGGPEADRLAQLVADHDLTSRAHLLGPVDHDRALALLAGASAFALCSRHEPQGIVILEAMAAGTPVVAAAVGGVPEVVDGANGLLWRPGDHHDLCRQLREVLTDPLVPSGLRAAGRSTAERFSWSDLADRYLDAYAGG